MCVGGSWGGWCCKFDHSSLPFSLKSQASLLLLSILNKQADVFPLLFFNCICWCARQHFQWDAKGAAHPAIKRALWSAQHVLCLSGACRSLPQLHKGVSTFQSLSCPYQRDALTVRKTAGRRARQKLPLPLTAHIPAFLLTIDYYTLSNICVLWGFNKMPAGYGRPELSGSKIFTIQLALPVNTVWQQLWLEKTYTDLHLNDMTKVAKCLGSRLLFDVVSNTRLAKRILAEVHRHIHRNYLCWYRLILKRNCSFK